MTTVFQPGGLPIGKLTARQFSSLVENGLFDDAEDYELADGHLIEKPMQKFRHQFGVRALERIFINRTLPPHDAHGNCTVQLSPIDVFDADLAVMKVSLEEMGRNPEGPDLALVAEVGDSTIAYDLEYKRLAYARAGVPLYWVLDMPRSVLVVHQDPRDGDYRDVQIYSGNDEIEVPYTVQRIRTASLFPA
ncbi:Uma2 family endonuclease [bacterium]|nr:MAG: Uma2 family endonuclease [bacterium]